MPDARFEDADEGPVRLIARDPDDLQVIAALCQDAVLLGSDMAFARRGRRLDILLNRFRWERGGAPERVRSVLSVLGALRVSSDGVGRDDGTVLSLLSIGFEGAADPEDPSGALLLAFAGDGTVRAEVEALEVHLRDVTRPYAAPSGKVPAHDG